MLVFEQRLGKKKTDRYMVTLIGEKDYMKKHGKKNENNASYSR